MSRLIYSELLNTHTDYCDRYRACEIVGCSINEIGKKASVHVWYARTDTSLFDRCKSLCSTCRSQTTCRGQIAAVSFEKITAGCH